MACNFSIVVQFRMVTPSPIALFTAANTAPALMPSGHQA
jgi:hypothetical protein